MTLQMKHNYMTDNIDAYSALQKKINNKLKSYLENKPSLESSLNEAISYSVLSGGKRLRPILTILTSELFNTSFEKIIPTAISIELMHCYSLIHDDLPAMDDDDYRRGQLSCHKKFNEATAILAGDALQSLAFEVIAESTLNDKQKNLIILELCRSCGTQGMIAGQAMDLSLLQNKNTTVEILSTIHHLKTGKLFESAIMIAMICSNIHDDKIKQSLLSFASHLGLAYQMQDDYQDLYVSSSVMGKPKFSDLNANKITYATLYEKKELKSLIHHNFITATNILNDLKLNTSNLIQFAHWLLPYKT